MDRGTDDAAAAGGAARTSVRGEIGVGLGWKERKGMGRGETLHATSEHNEHGGDKAVAAETVSDVCSWTCPHG
jgi:hypothetical protein